MRNSLDLKSLCDSCVEIAREAGRKILEVYDTEFDIEHKDDKSPLTNADMASHHTIVEALSALTGDSNDHVIELIDGGMFLQNLLIEINQSQGGRNIDGIEHRPKQHCMILTIAVAIAKGLTLARLE